MAQDATIGLLAAIGFIATSMGSLSLFEQRSSTLYLISNGYYLVSLMIIGAMSAVWR